MAAPVLRFAGLNLAASSSIQRPVLAAGGLEQLKWGLRNVRKGDTAALFAVLDNHFPRVVLASANGDEDDKRVLKRVKPDTEEETLEEWSLRLASFEDMPPELLATIYDRLLFDDRWVLGDTLYQDFKRHRALIYFRARLAESLGFLDGVLAERSESLAEENVVQVATAVLVTLYNFIVDLRDPLKEPFSSDEELWVSMGGFVNTRLAYQSKYPHKYMAFLASQTRIVLSRLSRESEELLLRTVLDKLRGHNVIVEKLFDQLAIFLGGYPAMVNEGSPFDKALLLNQLDNAFFRRRIQLNSVVPVTRFMISETFLKTVLGSYPTVYPDHPLTYSEIYAKRRLELTFNPYELGQRWGIHASWDQSDNGTLLVSVIQFQWYPEPHIAETRADWVPMYTLGLRLGQVPVSVFPEGSAHLPPTDAVKTIALQLFASTFGPRDMTIIAQRGIADIPVSMNSTTTRGFVSAGVAHKISAALQGVQLIPTVVSGLVSADNMFAGVYSSRDESRAGFVKHLLDVVTRDENGGPREFSRLPWLNHQRRVQLGRAFFWKQRSITKGKGVKRIMDFLFPQPMQDAQPDPAGGAFDFSYLKQTVLQSQRTAPWKVNNLTSGTHYLKPNFWRDDKPELDGIVKMTLDNMPEFEDLIDVRALPASAYGLRSPVIESQWALPAHRVPDYYSNKANVPFTSFSQVKMLYLKQSTIRGVDSNDPLSSVAMVAPQIMTFDRAALGAYLNFVDLKTSAQLGPSPALDYGIIPRKAWWEMWMWHHLNALHPTTLILFALHQFADRPDVSVPGSFSLDSRIWAWRTQEASVRVFFEWMWKTATEERNEISKLLESTLENRRTLEDRVIKARAALHNIIHSTTGTRIGVMGEFLRGIRPDGQPHPVRTALHQPFWEALQEETGWGRDAWPDFVVRDGVHLELFMD